MLIELEIALDSANLTWAHGVLLGLTCLSLIAVTVNRWLRWRSTSQKVDKINMIKVEMPFSVSIEDDKNVVTVRSSVLNRVEVYWDFYFDRFKDALYGRWINDMPVMDWTACAAQEIDATEKNEKTVNLQQQHIVVHSVPRSSYLIAIIVRNLRKTPKPREILALAVVYDIGDPSNSTSVTRVVGRYIKLNSGKITPLQRFYPSGLCQDGSSDLCVICRDTPVTRVVLPCRHACYCPACFDRVINCSMCTADIKTYFCIEPAVDDVDWTPIKKYWKNVCVTLNFTYKQKSFLGK